MHKLFKFLEENQCSHQTKSHIILQSDSGDYMCVKLFLKSTEI